MSLKIITNASLQVHNTMAVPASASKLAIVADLQDLQSALSYARQKKLTVLILGEGSNTVFTGNYEGMVIVNRLRGIEIIADRPESARIKVASGEKWHNFVEHSLRMGWYGLENLALIPGLVGAAPIQNIGAYGAEIKDSLVSLDLLDISSGKMISMDRDECCFAYRDSIFKNKLAGHSVITAVTFELSKNENVNISYPALAIYFDQQPRPTSQQVFAAVCQIRKRKLPLPDEIPNSGSFFKNPLVDIRQFQRLKAEYPSLVGFAVGEKFKLAAAWMIEQAGWKDKTIEQVRVHRSHALVITNPNRACGASVLKFARAVQADISDKFGVDLEIEPKLL